MTSTSARSPSSTVKPAGATTGLPTPARAATSESVAAAGWGPLLLAGRLSARGRGPHLACGPEGVEVSLGGGEGHGDETGALDLLRVGLEGLGDLHGERGQRIGLGRLHLLRAHAEGSGQAEGCVIVHRERLRRAWRGGGPLALLRRPRARGVAGGPPRRGRPFG